MGETTDTLTASGYSYIREVDEYWHGPNPQGRHAVGVKAHRGAIADAVAQVSTLSPGFISSKTPVLMASTSREAVSWYVGRRCPSLSHAPRGHSRCRFSTQPY